VTRSTKVGNYHVRRPQAVPFRMTAWDHLRDAAEIVAGVVVLLGVIGAVGFALFVLAGPQ
jgi:hypothetical protein